MRVTATTAAPSTPTPTPSPSASSRTRTSPTIWTTARCRRCWTPARHAGLRQARADARRRQALAGGRPGRARRLRRRARARGRGDGVARARELGAQVLVLGAAARGRRPGRGVRRGHGARRLPLRGVQGRPTRRRGPGSSGWSSPTTPTSARRSRAPSWWPRRSNARATCQRAAQRADADRAGRARAGAGRRARPHGRGRRPRGDRRAGMGAFAAVAPGRARSRR